MTYLDVHMDCGESRATIRGSRWPKRQWICVVLLVVATSANAQQSYRPGGSHDDPILFPRDLSGFSIRAPRVRIVHTAEPALAGGSMYLQQVDPWLGYLFGRELTQREFTPVEGIFGEVGKSDGVLLPDGATHMTSRDHVNSCMTCHNTPYRDAGAGTTIPKNGGTGRNTPHLFGAGLIEMIGSELRLAAMHAADDDRNGWIDLLEAKDKRFIYRTSPHDGAELDFGRFDDHDLDGQPDLNQVLYVVYVDGQGRRVPWAGKLTDPGVKGFRLEVQVFGHSQLRVSSRPPISGTLRAFTAAAFDIHQGLQAYDPLVLDEKEQSGVAGVSNAGCVQFVTAAGRDRGRILGPTGISFDDPDRDGVPHELTAGDLDVAEWYLLNHPRPARGRQTGLTRKGETLFREIGCATCHTPDWYLPPAAQDASDYTLRHVGDRRFFDLEVTYNDDRTRLEGRLVQLTDTRFAGQNPVHVPRGDGFHVRDLYSDLRYHDVGHDFYQVQYDGTVLRQFRTPPLWGVGTTAPYGHDGASLDLESVILRHGGEAFSSRQQFSALTDDEQQAVLAFLRSLVLYQTDQLACDINGDGRVDDSFKVAGQDVGCETLRPEWLLRMPCCVEGLQKNIAGDTMKSMSVINVRDAYGLSLDYLLDTDEDSWPDVVDPTPNNPGVR